MHRDLKADNCFVDSRLRLKIADFGTGRFRRTINEFAENETPSMSSPLSPQSRVSSPVSPAMAVSPSQRAITAACGSLLWMPPESFSEVTIEPELAPKIDVYAYGVLLWELWARRLPWEEIEEQGILFQEELAKRVCDGERPQLPKEYCDEAPNGFARLMHWCWSGDPSDRPTFGVVVEQVNQLKGRINPLSAVYE